MYVHKLSPEKIKALKEQIEGLSSQILLIAVSKRESAESIKIANEMGFKHFAESRLQEALTKQNCLKDLDLIWHFIGKLQTNKLKQILLNFSYIHSADSLEILIKLNQLAEELNLKTKNKILLQVKLAVDDNKTGFSETDLLNSLTIINELNNLNIIGLMTILPFGLSQAENYELFCKLKTLKEKINSKKLFNLNLTELSMGMSGDYPEAIKAGSTMLRLGRAIFLS